MNITITSENTGIRVKARQFNRGRYVQCTCKSCFVVYQKNGMTVDSATIAIKYGNWINKEKKKL